MSLLVVGLGNPGRFYQETRHNAGFWVVERLSDMLGIALRKRFLREYEMGIGHISGKKLVLAKPLTYMNNSGRVIRDIIKHAGVSREELLVVCDNLDLPIGTCRLRLKGSSAGHNGLKSIIAHLGDGNFMRMYIGIGKPEQRDEIVKYVLGKPGEEELEALNECVERACDGIIKLLDTEPAQVMNVINRKEQ